MRTALIAALLATTMAVPAYAQHAHDDHPGHDMPAAKAGPTPKEDLLVAPADARHFVVVSETGKHGDQWRWMLPDGRVAYRWSQELRGWITEMDQVDTVSADGAIIATEVRGVTMAGDAAESFSIKDGRAHWKSATDEGDAPVGGWYLPAGGVGLAGAPMIEALAAAGDKGLTFLPSGKGTLTIDRKVEITGPHGPETVQLGFVRGLLPSPVPVWLDMDGAFFGNIGAISLLPAGYEGVQKQLREAQETATAAAVKDIAHRFLAAENRAPVLFDNVSLFDADNGAFLEGRAVLARDGVIEAIGFAGQVEAPKGARMIDGTGKTLVPGIWDSHLHIGDDWDVLANMANGITSFRSPGTTLARALDATTRRKSGDLLMGEPFISVIVDKKDPLSAQGAEVVSSEEETLAVVRKIAEAGMWGVKFYTSMNPAWIAPAAAEAHKLGLHVHGHVPATMKPSEAVSAGYDELTHLNFVVMEAMPKEVIDKSNTRQRLEGPARYFKDVDLDGDLMKGFIADLAAKGTLVDPTIVIFEGMLAQDGEAPQAAYAPYMGIVSPVIERSAFVAGGYPLVEGTTRADYLKSYENMLALIGKLHAAGVPIVAGTDGWGIEIIREIELYQKAGMTAAEALQSATIVPARVVGADDRTGSIAVGKEADMVLVDGDVATDLGALRRVVTVVSDGYVMDGDELRTAAGFTGRPK